MQDGMIRRPQSSRRRRLGCRRRGIHEVSFAISEPWRMRCSAWRRRPANACSTCDRHRLDGPQRRPYGRPGHGRRHRPRPAAGARTLSAIAGRRSTTGWPTPRPALRRRGVRPGHLDLRRHVRCRPYAAPRELGRVCRRGGRLCLATWTPDGSVARFFAVMGGYSAAPPPPASPLLWGDPSHLQALLGRDFDLAFERGVSHCTTTASTTSGRGTWKASDPCGHCTTSLDEGGRRALRKDVDAYHEHYAAAPGLRISREYLVTIGHRR